METITLNEIISYSKGKENAPVTVIDNVNEEDLDYIKTVAERLRLYILAITDTNMLAVINRTDIAVKIASDIHRKCQVMYYDFIKRPSANLSAYIMTGYTPHWIVLKDNGYLVKAYNEYGKEIDQWLNTYNEDTTERKLNDITKYDISLNIRGCGNSRRCNATILELSRYYFIHGGTFNEARQCYYPSDVTSNKGKEEYNKLEKLFKRWGFNSL